MRQIYYFVDNREVLLDRVYQVLLLVLVDLLHPVVLVDL